MKDKAPLKKVVVSCGTKFHSDYMAYQLDKHGLLDKVITAHPRSRYLNRVPLNSKKVKFLTPIFALSYLIQKLLKKSNRLTKYLDYNTPLIFDKQASKLIKNADISITWAWSGLNTLSAMKKQGGITIVEECGSCNHQQNQILEQEYNNLGLSFNTPTPQFIVERELQEIKTADYILCPSRYVAESFINNGATVEKCVVIPYGVNPGMFYPKEKLDDDFTILFVGTVGVRKGLIYLFKALEIISRTHSAKCILIGSVEDQFKPIFDKYRRLFSHISYVKQQELNNYYSNASVFVFPSLDEGMAYVQLEAMACGLPVICTPNSGGDSVITNGKEGYIVPIRDADALADGILNLYLNEPLRKEMALNAVSQSQKFTWDAYGDKLASFINQL